MLNKPTVADRVDALTVASEFIMCAIRSLAHGEPHESREVQDVLGWAASKLEEGRRLGQPKSD